MYYNHNLLINLTENVNWGVVDVPYSVKERKINWVPKNRINKTKQFTTDLVHYEISLKNTNTPSLKK